MEFEESTGGRVHGRFLPCLHRVANSSKFRFLYSPKACFATTRLCTLVSPSLPSASICSVSCGSDGNLSYNSVYVHRYLLKSAITVCLMRHTAVQTSVAQRVCPAESSTHLSRATQSATLSSASICRRMSRDNSMRRCGEIAPFSAMLTASSSGSRKL